MPAKVKCIVRGIIVPTNPYRPRTKGAAKTKTERLAMDRLLMQLEHLKLEGEMLDYRIHSLVPEAWDTLERDVDVTEKKRKVTLYLDESVVKFFRAMGVGYQARINRILATFAQMRIAQVRRAEDMAREELTRIRELRD